MPPKKAAKDGKKDAKKGGQEQPEVLSKYVRREPDAAPAEPDLSEAEVAWKACRKQFELPLPEWDDKVVNTADWKPNEKSVPFTSDTFSPKLFPSRLAQCVTAWRRAPVALESSAQEEAEPQAKPLADLEEEEPPPDPKAKAKAKADPKAKAKAKGKDKDGDPEAKPTTAQQFADVAPGEVGVVSVQDFRAREVSLTNDDAMPPICQAIASLFSVIAEQRYWLPPGCFLWELIYPQSEEGMPLLNPHGKYIVRLFLMGSWRQVQIDDVVPIGAAPSNQAGPAPLLPASSSPNTIWPQLLTKALLRAFQADLRAPIMQMAIALTGWLPYQQPLTWELLTSSHTTRPFCCLEMTSQIDMEARQREALASMGMQPGGGGVRKNGGAGNPPVPSLSLQSGQPPVPKLGQQPTEADLHFLVCETEADPHQVRLKSSTWRPAKSSLEKTVSKDAESEVEYEDDEAQLRGGEPQDQESEVDEQDNDEEDEERRSLTSPSGGEPGQQSARSKEEAEAEGAEKPEGASNPEEDHASEAWVAPWPDELPAPPLMSSVMGQHHRELEGGYWIGFDMLKECCGSFFSFMPPGDSMIKGCLENVWGDGRKKPYNPTSRHLLRLRLKPDDRPGQMSEMLLKKSGSGDNQAKEKPVPHGPQWHRAFFIYEPLRADPAVAQKEGKAPSCLLRAMTGLQSSTSLDLRAPEYLHFSIGEASGGSTAIRSVLLPPGEHWYLVIDDAHYSAGSILSVFVDGSGLDINESTIEFLEPSDAFAQAPAAAIELTEYPAQRGFRLWAKAELELQEDAVANVEHLQLLSHVSDASLRPCLQLTFIRLLEEQGIEKESRCVGWSASTLARGPLLRIAALPLGPAQPANHTLKYILMLEACTTTAVRSGSYSLQLLLPSSQGPSAGRGVSKGSRGSKGSKEGSQPTAEDAAAQDVPSPLQLTLTKSDLLLRWHGDTAPNDKGLVMRERLTVPMGGGDVTATLRVALSGLPNVCLDATLVAQLPPREETRPKLPDGAPPEPREMGVPIDPKDYGGRRNWLGRCKTVAEESGTEVVVFPHVILCEGSTYILYVKVDAYKGPANLEGGQWCMEVYASGEAEAGEDTMEQDLEELVRRSWEDPNQDASQPTRQQKATESRRRWMDKNSAEGGDGTQEAATTSAEKPPGSAEEDEQQQLEQKKREQAANEVHANKFVRDFVELHDKVPAVLEAEDPYFVAPDVQPDQDAGNGRGGSLDSATAAAAREATFRNQGSQGSAIASAVEAEECYRRCCCYSEDVGDAGEAAMQGLGAKGMQEARLGEVEADKQRWEQAKEKMEAAMANNLEDLQKLTDWQSSFEAECEAKHTQLIAARDKLMNSFQERLQRQVNLRTAVQDEELNEAEQLQELLAKAREAGVHIWDSKLVESGDLKVRCIQEFTALGAVLNLADAEPTIERAMNEAFEAKVSSARELLTQVATQKVPLAAELRAEDVLSQAEELLAAFKELRGAVEDTEQLDAEPLQKAWTGVQGKEVWDAALVERGELKLKILQAFGVLRSAAAPLDPAAREEVTKAAEQAKELLPQLGEVPLPEAFGGEALLEQAEELLKT